MAHRLHTDDEVDETRTSAVGLDETHRALADEQRRALLGIVEGADLPVSLDRLATAVAAETTAADVNRVCIELHHKHLPLLADVGTLEYDSKSRRVTACHVTLPLRSD